MAEPASKLPVKTEGKPAERPAALTAWSPFAAYPFESLRREVDRLFEDFDPGFWRLPFRSSMFDSEPARRRDVVAATAPAVDVVEKDGAFEVVAELPGMDEKDIEVKLANGTLTIKGEKQEEKEEKKKDYYLRERRFGAFQRAFTVPDTVDADKIEAHFAKGVLTVTLPKRPDAVKAEKKIAVKSA